MSGKVKVFHNLRHAGNRKSQRLCLVEPEHFRRRKQIKYCYCFYIQLTSVINVVYDLETTCPVENLVIFIPINWPGIAKTRHTYMQC